jgi:hypothetical protein
MTMPVAGMFGLGGPEIAALLVLCGVVFVAVTIAKSVRKPNSFTRLP